MEGGPAKMKLLVRGWLPEGKCQGRRPGGGMREYTYEYTADTSFGANLDDYPTCAAVFKNISNLPEFVAADWKHQPDTPDDLRA